jgi:hypothetical protein
MTSVYAELRSARVCNKQYGMSHMRECHPHGASSPAPSLDVSIVPGGVLIDAEAGRIARILGQFGVYRAWAYALSIDNGDGWAEREALEIHWQKVSVASSTRQQAIWRSHFRTLQHRRERARNPHW